MVKGRVDMTSDIEREGFDYDCQGNHLIVGKRCMKCGAHIIDFGDYNEGINGWKLMKGTIGKKWNDSK